MGKWSKEEIEILKELYSLYNNDLLLKSIPNKTLSKIQQKAFKLGITREKLQHPKIYYTCIQCGKEVTRYSNLQNSNKFCSQKCYSEYRNPLGDATIICKICGKSKSVKRSEYNRGQHKYCSWECYKVDCPGNSRKRGGASYRRLQKAFKRDNGICQLCDNNAKSVHHIIPYREFENRKEADKLDNLILLCNECHRLTFGKEFEFVELFKRILENKEVLNG